MATEKRRIIKPGRRQRVLMLDDELWERLTELADFREESRSDVVNSALRVALGVGRKQREGSNA